MLWTLELSQRSPINGLQSGKSVILHIIRLTTLFPGLVCHEVPLKIHDLFDSREYSKRGGNCHERMSRTSQTSEAENRSKRDDERQSKRSSTSCIREGKI